MDIASAEMAKYAANAMLATRSPSWERDGLHFAAWGGRGERARPWADDRIGSKLRGRAAAGPAAPASQGRAGASGLRQATAESTPDGRGRGEHARQVPCWKKLRGRLGDLSSRVIALWGLAFQAQTSDTREAPAQVLIHGSPGPPSASDRGDARGAGDLPNVTTFRTLRGGAGRGRPGRGHGVGHLPPADSSGLVASLAHADRRRWAQRLLPRGDGAGRLHYSVGRPPVLPPPRPGGEGVSVRAVPAPARAGEFLRSGRAAETSVAVLATSLGTALIGGPLPRVPRGPILCRGCATRGRRRQPGGAGNVAVNLRGSGASGLLRAWWATTPSARSVRGHVQSFRIEPGFRPRPDPHPGEDPAGSAAAQLA